MIRYLILLFLFSTQLLVAQVDKIPDSWNTVQSEYQGKAMFIRKNNGLKDTDIKKAFHYRTGISFKFKEQTENGLPSSNEYESLTKLEDDLFKTFQDENKAAVALIITTSGFREFVIYSSNKKWSNNCFEKLKLMHKEYQLTTYGELDPSWTVYESF